MVQKMGEVKACLARVRHTRNKLAHSVKSIPAVKGIKAYNCAEAAYSFFKQIQFEDPYAYDHTVDTNNLSTQQKKNRKTRVEKFS